MQKEKHKTVFTIFVFRWFSHTRLVRKGVFGVWQQNFYEKNSVGNPKEFVFMLCTETELHT